MQAEFCRQKVIILIYSELYFIPLTRSITKQLPIVALQVEDQQQQLG